VPGRTPTLQKFFYFSFFFFSGRSSVTLPSDAFPICTFDQALNDLRLFYRPLNSPPPYLEKISFRLLLFLHSPVRKASLQSLSPFRPPLWLFIFLKRSVLCFSPLSYSLSQIRHPPVEVFSIFRILFCSPSLQPLS